MSFEQLIFRWFHQRANQRDFLLSYRLAARRVVKTQGGTVAVTFAALLSLPSMKLQSARFNLA